MSEKLPEAWELAEQEECLYEKIDDLTEMQDKICEELDQLKAVNSKLETALRLYLHRLSIMDPDRVEKLATEALAESAKLKEGK